MCKENIPLSTHIFMFPFKYEKLTLKGDNTNKTKSQKHDKTYKSRINIEDISNKLNANNWESIDYTVKDNFDYGCYMYFYPFVRRAVLSDVKNEEDLDECVVKNYEYKFKKGYYCIELKKGQKYQLKLNSIKLKLFNTGVGILSFEAENHREFDGYESAVEDVLNINDFGRRIYPQFYPIDAAKNNFLADKLSIILYDENNIERTIEEDFKSLFHIPKDEKCQKCRKPNEYVYISKTIMDLLGKDNFTYTTDTKNEGKILITPIIDDRMFVISFVNNQIVSSTITSNLQDNKDWAKYIFVDNSELTIQNDDMMKKLIDKHTYKRWLNYGTIYGITRYSFVGVAGNGIFPEQILRNHFRTMYYEMVSLALAVRASIISFSDEAASISALKIDKDNICEEKLVSKIDDLYKRYIEFVNRLYFKEVTAQEQGIELYNILIKSMNIERDIKDLNDEIEKLYNYATLKSEKNTNEKINLLAILGALLAIPSFFTGFFGINIFNKPIEMINWYKSSVGASWFYIYIIFPVCIFYLIFKDYLSIKKSIGKIKQSISSNITKKDKVIIIVLIVFFIISFKYLHK